MSEMIERVAKAIYSLDPIQDQEADVDGWPLGPVYDVPWDKAAEWDDAWYEHVLAQARAAIEAMRQPILSRMIYPVSTEINPRGWELREVPMLEEAVRFVSEATLSPSE